MSERRVDVGEARERLEAAIADHAQEFESFFLARWLGFEFEYLLSDAADADKETCRIRFPVSEMVMNPQGSLHGGVMTTAMDVSMGHLVKKIDAAGATIEMKIQFLRPLRNGPAICEGRFIKRGRSISFLESRIWDSDGKLAAQATATWKMA